MLGRSVPKSVHSQNYTAIIIWLKFIGCARILFSTANRQGMIAKSPKEVDMTDDGDKRTFPRLPAKNWWALREKFKQTMPNRVHADYLQSVLGLSSTASAGNLIGPLRTLGLIDDEGRPTERALDWRDDESYKQVCADMLSEVYPDALCSAFPSPSEDSSGVTNWFSRNTGAGQGTATAMSALYTLLSAGDPEGANTKASTTASSTNGSGGRPATSQNARRANRSEERATRKGSGRIEPALNINVQVHISSDASTDQIDQIFKSMTEHLYGVE